MIQTIYKLKNLHTKIYLAKKSLTKWYHRMRKLTVTPNFERGNIFSIYAK